MLDGALHDFAKIGAVVAPAGVEQVTRTGNDNSRRRRVGGGWVSEQCFTSPPTQYRLYGRRSSCEGATQVIRAKIFMLVSFVANLVTINDQLRFAGVVFYRLHHKPLYEYSMQQ